MSEALDFVGDFLIQETTGSVQDIILLRARALPYKPFTVEGTQREDTTWYAGNPVASQQVHGAQEMPTTINGKWKDRYIADPTLELAAVNGVTVSSVKELADAIDGIRKRGTEVLVQWMHLSRRGILKRFKQSWYDIHELEYEIEFEWNSSTDADVSNLGTREFDMSDLSGAFASNIADLAVASTPFVERLGEVADAITTGVADLQQAIADMDSAVASYLDGALSAINAARRSLSLIDTVMSTCDDVISKLYAVTDAAATGVNDLAKLASVPYGEILRAASITRDAVRLCRSLRRRAADARAKIVRSQNPELTAAFTARERTDLREVSVRYYGTPNQWHALQRFNGLSASYVDIGAVVLVPRDPTTTGAC